MRLRVATLCSLAAALFVALATLLLVALPAWAEEGVIEGRLRNGTSGAALPSELAITLEKLAPEGALTVTQQVKSSTDGTFRFTSIDVSGSYTYTVSAQYQDVTYRGAVSSLATGGTTTPAEL